MEKNITDKLINKHIRNECTEQESDVIENWLVDPKNRTAVNKLMKSQWEVYGAPNTSNEPNQCQLLSKVRSKIHPEDVKSTKKRWYALQWTRIAAILLLPLISAGVYYALSYAEQTTKIAYSHVENMSGQRSKIYLPDGSKVWLNAESKLSFPRKFEKDKREVVLEGEAFFDIVKNPDQPFIVTTADINIRVLGTSFNVSAFTQDLMIETTLETGKIAIKEINSKKDFLIMKPNQKAFYSKERQSFSIKDVDTSLSTSWKDGSLKFYDTPFSEVVKKLERWYGVEIQYADALNNNDHLTFTLNDESLEKILQLMKNLIPIKYSIEGKNIKIELE